MSRSLLRSIVAIVALGISVWAASTGLAGDRGSDDPQAPPSSKPIDAPPAFGHESPDVPKYGPGAATVVPPDHPAARAGNPEGDPNIRVCRFADGTLAQVIVSPVDPKNPFPPGDPTLPC
jgi:hypothetical protein